MECSICGVSELIKPLHRALSPTGIVLVCESCAMEQEYPIVKKPAITKVDFDKKDSVYETMVRLSGVKGREQPERFHPAGREVRAKEIINRGYERKAQVQQAVSLAPRPDLVDNFHWIIMRVRRVKGLTQGQLAERIGESESAVKMAEQGIVPSGYDILNKLEKFLGVKLVKEKILQQGKDLSNSNIMPARQSAKQIQETRKQEQQKVPYPKSGILNFDSKLMENMKVDDLKKMRQEKSWQEGENDKMEGEEASEEKKYAQDYD